MNTYTKKYASENKANPIPASRLQLGKTFNNEYLTKREIDVLTYVVLGQTAKKIAQSLQISYRTVESYIDTLKYKLGCRSKNEIAMITIKSGLIYQLKILNQGNGESLAA